MLKKSFKKKKRVIITNKKEAAEKPLFTFVTFVKPFVTFVFK
jgi:hypothetical protein